MKRKLKIAIDYDDVLALCTQYAVELEEKKGNKLDYSSIKQWGKTGRDTDVIFKYFADPEFYKTQPLYDGAQKFIKELSNREHDIVILTAIYPQFATIRANKIMDEFPEIKKENIILSSRKDLVHVDVLIDDAPHNIEDTPAKYPILFRRPWNESLTGLVSVYSYNEIIAFIDRVSEMNPETNFKNKVYCLVAPSGSGKTAIANELVKDPRFAIARSTTTRSRRSGEPENAYNFVSRDEFEALYKEGHFIETTIYAGNRYGTTKDEIQKILNEGKNPVMPIDMCGANALKMIFGEQCVIAFIKRPKADIVSALLDRMEEQLKSHPENAESIKADIQNRILSLNSEKKNEELADRIIINNSSIEQAVNQFY